MSEQATKGGATVYRGAHEVFRLRTSRKYRRCDYSRDTSWFRACSDIKPGQQYVHVTVYPGHDFVQTDRPQVGACCIACASGYTGMDTLTYVTPPEAGQS
jgi:hypothetical protein